MSLQQGGVSHMPGMMSHQGLGQQLVHPAPGGGAQMPGQWRQPLAGQQITPRRGGESSETCDSSRRDILEYRSENGLKGK